MKKNHPSEIRTLNKFQIEALADSFGIPIENQQLENIEFHFSILTNHANKLFAFELHKELEPAQEFEP